MSKTGPSSTVSANIILTDFEQSVLQSGKSYLEWSGKTALQIAEGTLVDAYGNPNLTQSDESGTMTAIEIKMRIQILQAKILMEKCLQIL